MALENDIKILGRVELFQHLNDDQLRLLAFGAETIRLTAGRDLYRQDAPADCAFVVVKGEVVLHKMQNGKRVNVATVNAGALLGELALIAPGRRLTGATAGSECELLRLNRKIFRRMLEEYPETAARLHHRISQGLLLMLDRIKLLGRAFED